jgi:hypothetical protein
MQIGISLGINRMRRAGGAFSPNSLFASGEAGDWFDPSDTTRMFTDVNGETAVTADGQAVALMLGQRVGDNVERVTNGTFTADTTGWVRGFDSVNGAFVASGGLGVYTVGASDGPSARMVTTLTGMRVGSVYKLTFTQGTASGAGDRFLVWTSAANGTGGISLNQVIAASWNGETKTYRVVATATTMYVAIAFGSTSVGATISVDNISVKEIALNAFSQSSLSLRPLYKTSAGLHWLQFDGTDDVMASAATLNPGSNDKSQFCAAVRKITSTATTRTIFECGTGTGRRGAAIDEGVAGLLNVYSGGTSTSTASASGYTTVPTDLVITGVADIAADQNIIRVNGAQVASAATDQGTGNYTTNTLNFGGRGGLLLSDKYFYFFLLRYGPALTGGQVASLETFAGRKAGLTI